MKKNKTRFCQKCGLEMTQTSISHGFDRFSGKEIKYIRYVCPSLYWEGMIRDERFSPFSETFRGHFYFEEKQ